MRKLALFALLCLFAVVGAAVSQAQTFDAYEVGGGVYLQTPKAPAGHLSLVKDITGNTFSYSTFEFRGITGGQPITSARTGIGRFVDSIGKVQIYGLGDAGAAISSTSSSGAFAIGALFGIPVHNSMGIGFGVQGLSTGAAGGWNPLFEFGLVFLPNRPMPASASPPGKKKLARVFRHVF